MSENDKGKPSKKPAKRLSSEGQRFALAGDFTSLVAPGLRRVEHATLQALNNDQVGTARRLLEYIAAGCPPVSSLAPIAAEARPGEGGSSTLVIPDRRLVEATTLDFDPDELQGCRTGAKFRFVYDRCEPLEDTLARRGNPTRIGRVLVDTFTDAHYPTSGHGVIEVVARAITFGKYMANTALDEWLNATVKETGKRLLWAPAQAEAQLLEAAPRPALDGCYPIAAYGNFWASVGGSRYVRYAYIVGEGRVVDDAWNHPEDGWGDSWWFLVLEYPLLEAQGT